MTDLRKAARLALEALEDVFGLEGKDVAAINALRQALAQEVTGDERENVKPKQTKSGPVAVDRLTDSGRSALDSASKSKSCTPDPHTPS